MDDRTLEFYESNAKACAEAWEHAWTAESVLAKLIRRTFEPGTRIVDVGCGSGRDLASIVAEGIEGWGIEPSDQLRRVAMARHPPLAGRLVPGHLPDGVPSLASLGGPFDGLLCIAVLQHVPRGKLLSAVLALKALLAPGARAVVSIPESAPPVDAEARDETGRLFSPVTGDELQLLFERTGFATRESHTDPDTLGRPDRTWRTLVFQLDPTSAARPLDLIAGVIESDRKSATYKLALLRALCEIAQRESRLVEWPGGGRVLVPLELVADRWLVYYWPLVADGRREFIPQLQGDWAGRVHRLGFAQSLSDLARAWGSRGPSAFLVERRSAVLGADLVRLERTVMRSLVRVIRSGPVTYSGLSTAGTPLFASAGKSLALSVELWRELTLMGHWIEDAILLRWAKLSSRFSHGEVLPSQVLDRLLEPLDPGRDVRDARMAYADLKPFRCTWTGAELGTTWEADHVLPFSVWRNNDLWNLMPASKMANAAKSDRLPARELLVARRDSISRCWDHVGAKLPRRFEAEARALTGSSAPSVSLLFDALLDAVETTALQRGIPRWGGVGRHESPSGE